MKKDNSELKSIKIFYDVLTEHERIDFLDRCKPLLRKYTTFSGLQTKNDIHKLSKENLNIVEKIRKKSKINASIQKSWMNYTDSEHAYEAWHDHDNPESWNYTACYMLDNPESLGTWFKCDEDVYKPKCPTNSLLVFSKSLLHTVPPDVTLPRYTLAIDFVPVIFEYV